MKQRSSLKESLRLALDRAGLATPLRSALTRAGLVPATRRSGSEYAFRGNRDAIISALREDYPDSAAFIPFLEGYSGPIVHKWHHYFGLYDRYFGRFRGQKVRFLEVGVSKGGSLEMWRWYLGPEAVIFGIDIDPACAQFDGSAGQVRIGSQADPGFLRSVVEEMGGVDVVLDDGSHVMDHISASLGVLFPLLSEGGVYMIEDLHTAFWQAFGGDNGWPDGVYSELLGIVEDMHHSYHDRPSRVPGLSTGAVGLHFHDSIAVLDKGPVRRPVHSRLGR